MTGIEDLQDQADRAERLAKTVTDALTVERLLSFAAECRNKIDALAETTRQAELA
ncbi:MAG: hypothetical protein JOY90_22005 [Bradyrhizobium sp.]|uniref:hypothetical protein n=1 Tax=Bradyrhizobium sp. TaxID=376 RepID=UPI001D6FE6B3|nr:hypothetical protein [Bradyrhizobium sp.]MBV9563092.1 hypothetical protein [Bradyrhizobium sp.]